VQTKQLREHKTKPTNLGVPLLISTAVVDNGNVLTRARIKKSAMFHFEKFGLCRVGADANWKKHKFVLPHLSVSSDTAVMADSHCVHLGCALRSKNSLEAESVLMEAASTAEFQNDQWRLGRMLSTLSALMVI